MRKFTYLLTMLALALGFSVARADVVTPYAYDFSGLGSGKLVSSFAPPGWAHYVDRFQADSWSTPSFVEYFAQETGGYGDDGACLKVGSQTLYDSYGESSQTMTDMIVTPAITGDASIYVKQSAAEGSVSFYTCTVASDGTVTKGGKYEVTVPALSTDAWTKVELPNVAAGTRLGICGDQVLLDEFSAASADVVLKREMTILSSPTMISSGDLCADADGNVQVQFKAKIKNSGEVPLAVGDEGYTVSLYDNTDGVAVGEPVPVSFPLAVGESQYLEGTVTMAVTKNYRHGFHLKENISGVTTYLGWIEVFPHAPVFTLEDNLSHDVENGSTVDFQVMQASTSKVLVISNAKGGAPLTINSVSVPEGFSYKISATENGEAATFPYEVAALGKAYLTVTMDASVVGKRSGNIVITPADGQGEVYTLAVTGEIVDPSKVYINFNDQKFPAGTYIELSSGQKKWKVSNFSYGENGYAATSDEVELSKFVLPKIRLAEGEHMTFDANKRNATSKLNVYYSADRKNWTQVKNITIDNSDDANCFAMGTYPSGYYDNFMYKTFTLDNIPAGTELKSITFLGYKNAYSNKEITSNLKIWMENTDATSPKQDEWYQSESMTQVYADTYAVAAVIGSSSDHQPIIKVTFNTPFTYTGGNLRVTVMSSAEQYSTTNFEVDGDHAALAAIRYADGALSGTMTLKPLPVTVFGFDKEASVFSGVVTSAADNAVVEGAEVKLVSDNVEYSGTTDAEGKFNFIVVQDGLEYNLTVSKEGFFADREKVNMGGTSFVKNVALNVAQGFNVLSADIPENAEVNSVYKVVARVENGEAKEAGSYRAELWMNDGIVATAETPALEASKEYDFEFSVIPHAVGAAETFVKFTAETGTAASETVNVTVNKEKGDAEVIVGTPTETATAGPADFFYKYSKTEIIYPKSLINLPAGTKINEIQFFGTHSSKNITFSVDAWIGNVAEGTALMGESTEGLTKVADKMTVDHSEAVTAENIKSVVTLTFPDGFVYDGGDIRLFLTSAGTAYNSTSFEVDKNVKGQAQQAKKDDETQMATASFSDISLPVAHFVVSPYKTLSGAVKNEKGEAVASAYIILASADGVEYYSETDAEGAFSMEVIKYGKEYTLTVSHPSYDAYTHPETISLADGDISGLAITLTKTYTFSGVVTDAETHAPIAGVEIYVSNPESGADVMTGTTDEDGVFDLKFKQLGTYDILFKAAGYDMVSYEGTPFEGDMVGTAVEMQQTVYTFSGVVTDAETKAPIKGVEVYVSDPASGADVATGTTDENGAFALKFKQLGTYNVLFKAAGYDMVSYEEVPFEGNFDTTVEMQKTERTFSGTVTDAESHAAIAGASVALYKGENKVAEATTGADGSFEIKVKDLAVFSLVVKAEGYEDFTFDTIDLTEGDMTDTPIEMTPNSGVGMLTADGIRVYGTVGAVVVESASEATVRVYNAAGSLVRRADVAGKTRIEGLQRGVYIVNGVKVIVK